MCLLCITVYYCVLLCITVYYCVLLCITVYYCVLLCITVYYCVLLCITYYKHVMSCRGYFYPVIKLIRKVLCLFTFMFLGLSRHKIYKLLISCCIYKIMFVRLLELLKMIPEAV